MRNLQVDVGPDDHDAAVAWWAAALGGTPRSTDEPEYTHLDQVRAAVGVHVQRLGAGPGGYHLDLETDGDVEREVARLLAHGATDVAALPGGEPGRVLADTAGLPFCVTTVGQAQHLSPARTPSDLRMLVLDVPADVHDAELAFWAVALGGEEGRSERYPEYGFVTGLAGPGGDVHLLVQALEDGEARLHVDVHVPDEAARDDEVARLVGLGARRLAAHESWVTLAAPGGQLLCVVPDMQ